MKAITQIARTYPGILRIRLFYLKSCKILTGMIILLIWFLSPLNLEAQFRQNSIVIKEIARKEKKIDLFPKEIIAYLKVIGRVDKGNDEIIIEFKPTFVEHDLTNDKIDTLKADKVSKLELSFELSLISLTPENYILNPIKKINVFDKAKNVNYKLIVNNPSKNLEFEFSYRLVYKNYKSSVDEKTKKLILECTNPSENQDSGGVLPDNSVALPENMKGGGGAGSAPKKTTGTVSDTVKAAELMPGLLDEYRKLYEKVYKKWIDSKDSLTYNAADIDLMKEDYSSANRKSENLNLNFSTVPDAKNFGKLYSAYKENIGGLLTELSTLLELSLNSKESKEDVAVSNEKGKTRLLTTLLIILGAILMAILVYFLIIKIQKKVKVNFQKKMKRKAELELNKQKFHVTRPENKLKL
ncbi:MAG: hypothetical protein V1775_08250 [Bacteroidota bacterium]